MKSNGTKTYAKELKFHRTVVQTLAGLFDRGYRLNEWTDIAKFSGDLEDTRQALNSNTSDVDTLQNKPGYDPDTDIDNDGHSDATGLETNDPANDGANSDDNGSGDGGYGDAGPGGFGDGNGGATI